MESKQIPLFPCFLRLVLLTRWRWCQYSCIWWLFLTWFSSLPFLDDQDIWCACPGSYIFLDMRGFRGLPARSGQVLSRVGPVGRFREFNLGQMGKQAAGKHAAYWRVMRYCYSILYEGESFLIHIALSLGRFRWCSYDHCFQDSLCTSSAGKKVPKNIHMRSTGELKFLDPSCNQRVADLFWANYRRPNCPIFVRESFQNVLV